MEKENFELTKITKKIAQLEALSDIVYRVNECAENYSGRFEAKDKEYTELLQEKDTDSYWLKDVKEERSKYFVKFQIAEQIKEMIEKLI